MNKKSCQTCLFYGQGSIYDLNDYCMGSDRTIKEETRLYPPFSNLFKTCGKTRRFYYNKEE